MQVMGLTSAGMIFLLLGWGIIAALTLFSFSKVLRTEAKKRKSAKD
jgi:hypothetical protein